jgi:hypothetical protein
MSEMFDDEFLQRLLVMTAAAEAVEMPADEFDDNDLAAAKLAEEAFEERGGDLAARKAALAELFQRRIRAFAAILQYVASDRGLGSIAALDEGRLSDLVSEGIELTKNWDEAYFDDIGLTASTEFQGLLAARHEIDDDIMALQDEIYLPPDEG